MQAQMVIQILEYLQIITASERQIGIYKDVNDLDEIPLDVGIELGY